ncbi:MAG TPA: transglutaminase family protein, partial [Immundisolibacter sp.]
GLFAGEGHIPLACTAEPASAAPVTGATGKCEVEFHFRNTVTRIHEDPRVTRPYSEHQWACMLALGRQVDQDLVAGDVRLTQGGEPTFVSIDDMDGAEWTVAADGPHKRERARDLTRRLWQHFAPGGLLHYGQGKWYPGEALPRWALACYWRKDSVALWREPALLADFDRDYGHDLAAAQRLAQALTGHLGVPAQHLMPAFEDIVYYLWQEGQLPADVDPHTADLKDPAERRRLAELLGRGLGEPAGFVLPLHWDYRHGGWRSGPWPLRRQRLYLVPGDSPLGLRLPLDSLPWEAEREEPQPAQLFEPKPALGDYYGEVARRYSQVTATPTPSQQAPADEHDETAPAKVIHTALCVQARHGRLHIFLPPLTELEHYIELMAAVEASAAACGLPVVLEGYEPPRDGRLERLAVTPDPGVIEVNVHPAASWDALVETTSTLYALAREARLGTEKFMLDGRHTGTGGGNHITLGGPTPADSPLLRRPDLLRSLLTYWQHHPGLSFLFSGLFIGPTSQAPRVDEARADTVYELEIAFEQLEAQFKAGEPNEKPWLVDRILRNFLV